MKTSITAQQLVYFRKNGHIGFENFPADFSTISAIAEKSSEKRDLWRHHPSLQKLILRTLAPLAIELVGKKSLRLACDQWIDASPTPTRMQDMFCFQGLALIFVLTATSLDIYEPSSLTSLITPPAYIIAYGYDNVRFVLNPSDPYIPALKKMGYAYGDLLATEFHPIIFKA